ncbi:MAG: AAA family ATPase [Anaerolineae bacterium]|nr:AAA family ATPase [Anaerolineae bacterium]
MLRIFLLGQPHLQWHSKPLTLGAPPKTLPLLAYLLLNRAQPVSREQVAFALWSDEAETVARANLRRHLHYLQRALPPAPPDFPWILSPAKMLRWNDQAAFWLDVAEFERLCDRPETLAQAAALYGGDLLEAVYDDWIFFERERLREQYFACLGQLILQSRSQRDFSSAIGYAQQLLGRDPLREDIVRQLIALRYESGDRAGALQEYKRFAQLLQEELATCPMPETQALCELITRNASLPPESPELTSPVMRLEVVEPAPDAPGPFVGRELEMERLLAHWGRAAEGRGGVAFVAGEAGVGKSRLACQLALLVEAQGGRVLWGNTSPDETRPYQAMACAFESALPLLSSLDIAPIWLAAVAPLIHGLGQRRDLPALPALDAERERLRLFDALAACLEKLSEPRPVLLVLEDLQWAGEATLSLLEFLAHRVSARPILILATYREEEVHRAHPLRQTRRRLQKESLAAHLALDRLSVTAVSQMLSAALQDCVPGGDRRSAGFFELADRLYAESEGNALFAVLWIQNWCENPDGVAPPGGVRAVIAARLECLTSPTRAVADVLAILGPVFSVELAHEVGGWSESQVLEALDELLDCRLVRDVGGQRLLDYAFSHHLIQSTLYEYIPPGKRKSRHRRAAQVMEELYADSLDDWAGELALHYDRGGNANQAIGYYLRAARSLLAVYADGEALSALCRAFVLAPADLPPEERYDLLALRESIYSRRGECALQQADLEQMEEIARRLGDAERVAQVLHRRILYHRALGERPAELAAVESLRRHAGEMGSRPWQAEALQAEGKYRLLTCDYPMASALWQQAMELCRVLDDVSGQINCCCGLAEVALQLRRHADAEAWAQKALALGREQDQAERLMESLRLVAAAYLSHGELELCLASSRQLQELAKRVGDRRWEASSHTLMGIVATYRFDISEAHRHLTTALGIYRLIQNLGGQKVTLSNLGLLALHQGKPQEARAYYLQSIALSEQLGDLKSQTIANLCLAGVAEMQGDFVAEKDYSEQALALAQRTQNRYMEASALGGLGSAWRKLGDPAAAVRYCREAEAIYTGLDQLRGLVTALKDEALAHLTLDDIPAAIQVADKLEALYPRVQNNIENPQCLLWAIGRVRRAAGGLERAQEIVGRAYGVYQEKVARISDAESQQAYRQIFYNREIVAAFERGEWP